MIIIVPAPLSAGVEIIIRGATAVGLVDHIKRLGLGYAVTQSNSVLAVLDIRVNKHGKTVGAFAQNVVGASADENAAFSFSDLTNKGGLLDEKLVVEGKNRGMTRRKTKEV